MQKTCKLLNYEFGYVQELAPAKSMFGQIKLFHPETSYYNVSGFKLHQYGQGPFCHFSINPKWSGVSGVYAFCIDNELIYIGQCRDFAKRLNMGYGNISPRNCFEGGQSTNCKMNKVVLAAYKARKKVHLYFHTTRNYDQIEYELIQYYNPKYNVARTSLPNETTWEPKSHEPKSIQKPKNIRPIQSRDAVKKYILEIFQNERLKGHKTVVLRSGDIHKAMPTVCNAMNDLKKPTDRILCRTPSGYSSTIQIEYNL